MKISFDVISDAYFFVSSGQPYAYNAYLCKETGKIYYTSDFGDSDALPSDINSGKYISIPHKNDLDLGEKLVFDFIANHYPTELEKFLTIFQNKGAYSKFKNFLEEKGASDNWYNYEEKMENSALKEWCTENKIDLKD